MGTCAWRTTQKKSPFTRRPGLVAGQWFDELVSAWGCARRVSNPPSPGRCGSPRGRAATDCVGCPGVGHRREATVPRAGTTSRSGVQVAEVGINLRLGECAAAERDFPPVRGDATTYD